MKLLKLTLAWVILLFCIICQKIGNIYHGEKYAIYDVIEYSNAFWGIDREHSILDPFDYAESVTDVPAELLRGIAAIESDFDIYAVGDDGLSHGMFQLHNRWHDSRVEKWGDFNPNDPYESAVIAGWIMQDNLKAFDGDLRKAIAAYKQGVTGVNRNGVIEWYVDGVLNWRDSKKILSFYLFYGITDLEEMRNGKYQSTKTQTVYKLGDSTAIQVSRWGSGSISQSRGED
jgi:hypothetical protein